MARPRAKTTLDTNGRQGQSLAPTNAPKQDNKDRRPLLRENGNGTASDANRARIEKLAYELYQQRGRQNGYDEQDWLEAERMTLTQPGRATQDRPGRFPTETLA